MHIVTRITRHFVFWTLFTIALTLSAIRIALLCVDLYKTELEIKLTKLLAAPVKVGQLNAHFRRGLKPELILKKISVSSLHTTNKPDIELQEIRVGLDLFALLKYRQLVPATWITLVGAKLSVIHKTDGSFAILGLQGGGQERPYWLLEGRHYELLQSQITWIDEKNHLPAFTFKQVDIAIKNRLSKQQHRLNLISYLPADYGESLSISAEINGDFFNSDKLNAEVFISGKKINFAKLITLPLSLDLKIKSGRGDFEAWGNIKNSQLTSLTGKVDSENLSLQTAKQKPLQFTNLNSYFDWRAQTNSWMLAVHDLGMGLQHKTYPHAKFYLGSNDKNAEHIGVNINSLDLEALQTVGEFFLPLLAKDLPDFKNLTGLNLKGQLTNTLFFADLKQKTYAINGQFKHLSIASPAPYPQLQNLSGSIEGTEQQGDLILNTQNANFIAQPMFRSILSIKQLVGQLHWQQTEKTWFLSASDLNLTTPHIKLNNALQVTIPKDEQPAFMDLQSSFVGLKDASYAKVYFPVTLMSKGLLDYLDQAFLKGQIKNGNLLFYGYFKDFPFTKHQGVFQVLFDSEDMTMKYATGWPAFEHVNSRIVFENESVEINVKQGKAEKATITSAKISIPSFSTSPYLLVEGLASSEINDGLSFLRHSPLDLPLKQVAEQLVMQGNTNVSLDLKIPLVDNVTPKIIGSASVANAKLQVSAVDLPINNLTGVFRFTENGFYSDTLQAVGLGYPLQAKVSYNAESTLINVTGKTDIKNLERQFDFSSSNLARGASDYTVLLTLPFSERVSPQLTVRSDLQGVAMALPDTLAKKAEEKRNLEIKFNLTDGVNLPVSFDYAQQLKANLLVAKKEKKLTGATLLLGKGEIGAAQVDKLKLKIHQNHFSPPLWLAALDKFQNTSDKKNLLTELDIYTPQLDWSGQQLGRFDLKLQQSAGYWSGTLDCAAAKGHVQIPRSSEKNAKLKLDMEQLDLTSLMALNLSKQSSSKPSQLPLFEINSQKLLLRGVNLGKLSLDSERYGQGIKFKNFKVTDKDQTLSLTGNWQLLNNQESTHVTGVLEAENFGELLGKLDLNDDLKETQAQVNLDLHWPAAPYQFSLASLSGTMDFKLGEGRISSIEPGFGRLLGVLAMEQWLKRLQLDFGDIYKEGLSFDQITGHFNVINGKATTDNLTVDGVPATINLRGVVNLAEQTLDQQISVIPKSSDAVPIAGTIVGGIATVVTQTITGEYEEGYYFRSKYHVKGKWDNLSVTPLHEQDGLFKKTWRGLTDFSWITQP